MKLPDPNWQVTVQAAQEVARRKPDGSLELLGVAPGYVQVDDVSGGENRWSKGPGALRAEGYPVPDFSRLPAGRYSWALAVALLSEEGGS